MLAAIITSSRIDVLNTISFSFLPSFHENVSHTDCVPWPVVAGKIFFKDVMLEHGSTSNRELIRTEMVRNEGMCQAWDMHIMGSRTQ